jgi:hypothetical protein
MIGDFGPSQVGRGARGGGTTIITTDEWNTLTSLCLSGMDHLSRAEKKLLSGFRAAESIIVTTYGLSSLLWFITRRRFPTRAKGMQKKLSSVPSEASRKQKKIGV